MAVDSEGRGRARERFDMDEVGVGDSMVAQGSERSTRFRGGAGAEGVMNTTWFLFVRVAEVVGLGWWMVRPLLLVSLLYGAEL